MSIMKSWDTVAILGVGLIGGSIGLGLRQRGLAERVVGIGRNPQRLETARRLGAVTSTTSHIEEGVSGADLVVICTPVERIVDQVRQVAAACPAGALITDAGSTKVAICRALRSGTGGAGVFVGSHPMAGSEKSGVRHARAGLFENRVAIITPWDDSDGEAVERIADFWASLGCRVMRMRPEEHDATVAWISHVPHVVAAALAAATPAEHVPVAAGGWRDTTRVAGANPELWQQILTQNQHHVLKSLDKFEKVLAAFREALDAGDSSKLEQLLQAGKQNRDALGG